MDFIPDDKVVTLVGATPPLLNQIQTTSLCALLYAIANDFAAPNPSTYPHPESTLP